MKLITKELAKKIPKLREQEGKGKDAICYIHYFYGIMDWYVLEYDGEDEFFGIVITRDDIEYGYFYLSEFEEIRAVERDLYFKPTKIGDIERLKGFAK